MKDIIKMLARNSNATLKILLNIIELFGLMPKILSNASFFIVYFNLWANSEIKTQPINFVLSRNPILLDEYLESKLERIDIGILVLVRQFETYLQQYSITEINSFYLTEQH